MQEKKKQISQYLAKQVNCFIEPLVYQIVKKKPTDPVAFSIDYLRSIIDSRKAAKDGQDSDSDSDNVDQLPFDQSKLSKIKNQGKKNSRFAISEEVFGNFNKKESFIPKIINKSEEAKVLILSLIRNSILFQNLDSRDQEVIINAMDQRKIEQGQTVITEGQPGDNLFIVQKGQYACSKIIGGKDTFLKNYTYGDSFGQLALLYNAPRAASIKCTKKGSLYVLDRLTFSHIAKHAATKKRQSILLVLSKIQIFSEINPSEKEQFIDVLKQERFDSGQYVIKQGQSGDKFYIIIDGKLVAEKESPEGPRVVYHYKAGDYFGQLALIHNQSRQASVKCLTPVRVAAIQRESFKRIIGSLEDILNRNEERYKQFQDKFQN